MPVRKAKRFMEPFYSKFRGGAVTAGAAVFEDGAVVGLTWGFVCGLLVGGPACPASGFAVGASVTVGATVGGGSATVATVWTVVALGGGAAVVDGACVALSVAAAGFAAPLSWSAKNRPTPDARTRAAPPAMKGNRFFRAAATACVVPHAVPPVPILGFDEEPNDGMLTIGGRDGRWSVEWMRSLAPRAISEYGSSAAASSATFSKRCAGFFSRHLRTTVLRPSGISARRLFGGSG